MNELIKTIVILILGAGLLVAGILVQPSPESQDEALQQVDAPFFEEFSPQSVQRLEISQFDERDSTLRNFVVQRDGDQWKLPSHSYYTVDAEDHMKAAVNMFAGLVKKAHVTGEVNEHETYNVRDPEQVEFGDQGVGTLVRFFGEDDKVLGSLIVGSKLKDQPGADPHAGMNKADDETPAVLRDETLYYVREPGSDHVFVADVRIDRLSTQFKDWVDADVLKIAGNEVKRVTLRNYSFDEQAGRPIAEPPLPLEFDRYGQPKWDFVDAPDKPLELIVTELNDMHETLDALSVVGVERKPESLIKLVKANNTADSHKLPEGATEQELNEALFALQDRGFYVRPVPPDTLEVAANEGQLEVGMADGVEYVLRFGEVTGGGETDDDAVNRYIYVVARVNKDLLEKPELKPIPEYKPGGADSSKDDGADAPTGNGDAPSDEGAAGTGESSGADDAEGDAASDSNSNDSDTNKADTTPPPAGNDADAAPGDHADAAPSDNADAPPSANGEPPVIGPQPDPARAAYEQQVAEIKAENDRLQREYEQKVAAAQEKVDEINERLAEWFYVIAEKDYKAIHLSRADVLRDGLAVLEQVKQQPGVTVTDSGLVYQSLESGDGESPFADDEVEVRYTIKLLDGAVVEETEAGETDSMQPGDKFAGFAEALRLMQVGDKWKLHVPPDLAYGKEGHGEKVGPNAVLVVDVKLVDVERSEATKNKLAAEAFLSKNKEKEGVVVTDSGLQYEVLQPGEGASPSASDTVEVRYKGTLLNGEVFDQTEGDETTTFTVGRVIPGWTEALQLMKPGAKWKLYIPPDLAYGERGGQPNPITGEPAKIGPNEALIFEVELVGIISDMPTPAPDDGDAASDASDNGDDAAKGDAKDGDQADDGADDANSRESSSRGDDAAHLAAITRDLRSDERQVRLSAIAKLEKLGTPEAAKAIGQLIRDDDVVVARRSLQAMGRLSDVVDAKSIASALSDERPEIREAAVVALGLRHRDADAAAALRRVLRDTKESAEVRAAAAVELGEQRNWDAMPVLIEALNAESRVLRATASGAIERIVGVGFASTEEPGVPTYSVDDAPDKRAEFVEFFLDDYKKYKAVHDAFIEFEKKQGSPPFE